MTNIKRLLVGLFLVLLLFVLVACNNRSTVPTDNWYQSSFDRAHSSTFYIARVTDFRDKPHRDNYQLTECETIWNDSKFDLVYFSLNSFPDLAPGQVYLLYPVDHGAAYEANHGLAMGKDGYFHLGSYPKSGSHVIDDYNNAIKENNEKSNRIQSMPTEYLEGDVTLEELIAFFDAMHDAWIEMKQKSA